MHLSGVLSGGEEVEEDGVSAILPNLLYCICKERREGEEGVGGLGWGPKFEQLDEWCGKLIFGMSISSCAFKGRCMSDESLLSSGIKSHDYSISDLRIGHVSHFQ